MPTPQRTVRAAERLRRSSFVAQVLASQLIPGSTDSFTTTVQGQTETAEIGLVYTSAGSSTTPGGGTGTGTIGIAVQPGVAGTNSAASNGTNGSGGSGSDAEFSITNPYPADTTTPTFASLYLQAMQFIIPSAGAATTGPSAATAGVKLSLAVVEAEVTLNNQSSVDNHCIASMIMQESGFYPSIKVNPTSPDSPVGLMQVKPSTFLNMQRLYPSVLGSFTASQLTDPAVNIEAGTIYIQYLVDKSGGDLSAALQHYGTGAYVPIMMGAAYLDSAGADATAAGLYKAILQAR